MSLIFDPITIIPRTHTVCEKLTKIEIKKTCDLFSLNVCYTPTPHNLVLPTRENSGRNLIHLIEFGIFWFCFVFRFFLFCAYFQNIHVAIVAFHCFGTHKKYKKKTSDRWLLMGLFIFILNTITWWINFNLNSTRFQVQSIYLHDVSLLKSDSGTINKHKN